MYTINSDPQLPESSTTLFAVLKVTWVDDDDDDDDKPIQQLIFVKADKGICKKQQNSVISLLQVHVYFLNMITKLFWN